MTEDKMRIYNGIHSFKTDIPTAVTVGKFDGFHLGHQDLLAALLKEKQKGLRTVVMMLDFSAVSEVNSGNILTHAEAEEYLQAAAVDVLLRVPVDAAFLSLSARAFIEEILVNRLKTKTIISGPDFTFGHHREGDTEALRIAGKQYGFSLEIVPERVINGRTVSSSLIREELSNGRIENANFYLGHPFLIGGTVIHGNAFARQWGYPTANIRPDTKKYLPKFGVYKVWAKIDGKMRPGMANLGTKPTVTDALEVILEVHFPGFEGDLYDRHISVFFERFIRPEERFSSVDELKAKIAEDVERIRAERKRL